MQPGMATQIELLKLTGNSSAFCIKLDIFACVVATSKLKPIQLQFSCSDLHRKRAPDQRRLKRECSQSDGSGPTEEEGPKSIM